MIVDNEVFHPEAYREYIAKVTPTVAAYGGRYLVRGGRVEVLDGTWRPSRLVVIEFEDRERALTWIHAPEIQPLHDLRRAHALSHMVVVEGV